MRKLKLFAAALALMGGVSSANAQGTWTAPAIPGSDIATTNSGSYAIYNIKADAFMGEGMNYGTEAIACRAEGGYSAGLANRQKFTLTVNGSTVKMVHNNHATVGVGCASANADDVYADYGSNNVWTFSNSSNYSNAYTLTLSGFGTLDVADKWGGKLTVKDGKGYTDWAFIPESSLTDGSFAKWMERKAMYGVYEALVASGSTTTYATALETANAVYVNSSASVADLRAATRALIIAAAEGIQQPTDVSALFTNANMQQDGTTDWTSTTVTRSGGAIEVYHGAITLTQSKTDVPNGLYTLIFRGMQRQEGSDAAPVFKAESGSNVLTATVPFMADLASRWNVRGGNNDWKGTDGSKVPDRIWRAAEGIAYEGASAKIDNFKVTGNELTLSVVQNSNSQWFTFNSFEVIYNGPVNLALYNKIVTAKATAEGLLSSAMNATVKTALNSAISGAEGLTANSEEDALNAALSALNTAILNANASIAIYSEISNLIAKLNTQDASFDVDTKYNDGTYTAVSEVYSDYYTYAIGKLGTAANTDFTMAIVNPGFEFGNTMGWTYDPSTDHGAKSTSSDTYKMTNSEGSYLFNIWDTGHPITQTIPGLPNGLYQVKAVVSNSGGAVYLLANGAHEFMRTEDSAIGYEVSTKVAVTDGSLTIGAVGSNNDAEMSYTANGVWWYKVDNFQLVYLGDVVSDDDAAAILAEVPTGKMGAAEQTALDGAVNTFEGSKTTDNYAALRTAIDNANASITAYANAKTQLDLIVAELAGTNVYDATLLTALQTAYNDGTWTTAEANAITMLHNKDWRAANTIDDILMSYWDENVEQWDSYHVNTWSKEGDSDGTNFKVPFYEYWTDDTKSLSAKTMTATVPGLTANGVYTVSAWVRVRQTNNQSIVDNSITLQVGEGSTVNVTAGSQIGSSQFYIAEYTAKGTADENGNLVIKFNVAAESNISWIAFKNVKYTEFVAPTSEEITALNTAISNAEAKTLGFEAGEYAPYNNVAALEALAAAKAIDATIASGDAVVAATNALTAANWTANDAALSEAVYDGAFANTAVGAVNVTGVAGWSTEDVNNMRQMVAADKFNSGKGLYIWPITISYGKTPGYTMPLTANSVYKFTYSYGGWNNGTTSPTVTIETENGKVVDAIAAGASPKYDSGVTTYTVYFATGNTKENYIFSHTSPTSTNMVLGDISMEKVDALEFADGSVPNYVPGTYPAVKITRTLTEGRWATAVYPFAVSGVDKIAVLDSYDKTTGDLKFATATESVANVPFLMRSEAGATEISLNDVEVAAAVATDATASEASLKGTYTSIDITNADKNYVLSDNAIYSVGDAGATINPYRAYIQVAQDGGATRALRFVVDGEQTTAIEGIDAENAENGLVYNLNGQRVVKAQKGLYIVNGKKVVKK